MVGRGYARMLALGTRSGARLTYPALSAVVTILSEWDVGPFLEPRLQAPDHNILRPTNG